jgi:hypothetical protein
MVICRQVPQESLVKRNIYRRKKAGSSRIEIIPAATKEHAADL